MICDALRALVQVLGFRNVIKEGTNSYRKADAYWRVIIEGFAVVIQWQTKVKEVTNAWSTSGVWVI